MLRSALVTLVLAASSAAAGAATSAVCTAAAQTDARAAAERVALCDLSTPIASTVWRCDGSAPESVTAVFFATEPGTVRLKYAGTVEVAFQTLAASGARYETRSGLVFWTKGSQSTVERPGAAPVVCTGG